MCIGKLVRTLLPPFDAYLINKKVAQEIGRHEETIEQGGDHGYAALEAPVIERMYEQTLERKSRLEDKAQGILAYSSLELAVAALLINSTTADGVGLAYSTIIFLCVLATLMQGISAVQALRIQTWSIVGISKRNELTGEGSDALSRELGWCAKLNEQRTVILANWLHAAIDCTMFSIPALSVAALFKAVGLA